MRWLAARRIPLLCALVLVLGVAAVFLPLRQAPFVAFDDVAYVRENPIVREGLSLAGLRRAFLGYHSGNWHPLTWVSHMLDVSLLGLDPAGHHLENVGWHALNVVLLFSLLRSLTGTAWRSACAAALFAVHPLHVESVAWVAERKDLLSTFLLLLTARAHLRFVRAPSPGRRLLPPLLFALGLMAKPMVVTAPFLLLLLDWWPLGRLAARPGPAAAPGALRAAALIREKLPLFVLAAASSAITLVVQQRGGAVRPLTVLPLGMRAGNAVVSYLAYLGKTLWPVDLGIFYPHPAATLSGWRVALSLAVLAAATLLVLRAARAFPAGAVGWLWYLGSLVPVIGLVQVGNQAMADRYLYIPSIGLFVAAVWGAASLPLPGRPRRLALAAAALAAILPLAALARRQAGYYRSNEAIWLRTLEVAGPHPVILTNLGAEYLSRGNYAEAERRYREVLSIDPRGAVGNYNYADLLVKLGRDEQAVPFLRRALEADPGHWGARYYLGVLLADRGDPAEAVEHLRLALRGSPGHPLIRATLARLGAAGE